VTFFVSEVLVRLLVIVVAFFPFGVVLRGRRSFLSLDRASLEYVLSGESTRLDVMW
jgi:hypothetical protein